MRPAGQQKLRPKLPLDDTFVLLVWLLALAGAFGVTCWLGYRLVEMPPFVLVPPSLGGS